MKRKCSIPLVHIKYAHAFIYLSFASQCLFFISLSLSFSCALYLPLSLTSSQRFIPFMLMDNPPPHVYLIKNQLKTPRRRVSRAEPRLRVEQKRFPHSIPLFLPLTISPSPSLLLSASPSLFLLWSPSLSLKLRPPVYWKLAT